MKEIDTFWCGKTAIVGKRIKSETTIMASECKTYVHMKTRYKIYIRTLSCATKQTTAKLMPLTAIIRV